MVAHPMLANRDPAGYLLAPSVHQVARKLLAGAGKFDLGVYKGKASVAAFQNLFLSSCSQRSSPDEEEGKKVSSRM